MTEAISRLGEGKWVIEHKGKKYVRKVRRAVKSGRIIQWVIIDGEKVYLKSVRVR